MNNYEKYKLIWMINHNYSIEDLVRELDDARQDHHPQASLTEVFDEWEMNSGFRGEIWACENEWEQCEAKMEESKPRIDIPCDKKNSPQKILLTMSAFDGRLKLVAEENPIPEYGPEITISIADENEDIQDIVVVRERKIVLRDSEPKSAMEVLLWKDEMSEKYTDSFTIPLYAKSLTEVTLPEGFFNEKKANDKLSPESALARSISDKGRVDMEYMESVSGLSELGLADALKGIIFPLPLSADETGRSRYATAGEYLTGTREALQARYELAYKASQDHIMFDENVKALEQVLGSKGYLDEKSIKYIKEIGGWVDNLDMIHVKNDAPYLQDAVKYPGKKSLMIPTDKGITLIFEGMHFVLEN